MAEALIVQLMRNYRQALLLLVDGIERFLDIRPRTAELRRAEKQPERSA